MNNNTSRPILTRIITALIGILLISACQQTIQEAAQSPAPETVTPINQNNETPSASPEIEIAEATEEAAIDECVECHTDKQSLIDTAKPLEVVEPENEGEG